MVKSGKKWRRFCKCLRKPLRYWEHSGTRSLINGAWASESQSASGESTDSLPSCNKLPAVTSNFAHRSCKTTILMSRCRHRRRPVMKFQTRIRARTLCWDLTSGNSDYHCDRRPPTWNWPASWVQMSTYAWEVGKSSQLLVVRFILPVPASPPCGMWKLTLHLATQRIASSSSKW